MKARKRDGGVGNLPRWSKLSDQLEAKLVAHVKEGLSFKRCCDLVGVARCTFYDWLARGEKAPESRFGAFARAIAKAESESMRTLHLQVAAADPRWILARRWPDEYSEPKTRSEVSGPDGGPIAMTGFHKMTISCASDAPKIPIISNTTGLPINRNLPTNGA
jgi:hypothetical protein